MSLARRQVDRLKRLAGAGAWCEVSASLSTRDALAEQTASRGMGRGVAVGWCAGLSEPLFYSHLGNGCGCHSCLIVLTQQIHASVAL